ncbi:uncharacterized protein LOC119689568 isoform X2 [Teleopsis dalmanni]|uniref:uncharacterized protein LOC119689568 isoform X2 n=1 Tax=Teleopsis dalmanni TaxID=139649 RepID=UPI0018CC9D41|nr:uncharacterized protein LOC119689568 isoform X2 [Teleopsis dalmanni]
MKPSVDEENVNPDSEQEAVFMRRRTLVGPWKYNEEFNKVYNWIFGERHDNSTHMLANAELDVWMNRRGYLCPAGITATKAILDAIIKDRKEVYSENDIKIFYAFGITRFVNHMLSTQLNQNMRSMYDVAREINLWTLVIDVRHICAHEIVLPELKMLREVSVYCLEWLREHYWCPLRDTMLELKGCLKRTREKLTCEKTVHALFVIYDAAFECIVKGGQKLKQAKRYLYKDKEKLTLISDYSKRIKSKELRKILNSVVSELNSIGQREILSDGYAALNCEGFFKMTRFLTVTQYYKAEQNLETIVPLTQSLFRFMANYGILRKVFDRLVSSAEKHEEGKQYYRSAIFWAKLILNGFIAYTKCQRMYQEEFSKNSKLKSIDFTVINTGVLPNRIKKFLLYSNVDLDCTLVFGNSKYSPKQFLFSQDYGRTRLERVNLDTAPILLGLLNLFDPELEEEKRQQLKSLMNNLMGQTLNEQTIEDDYVPKTLTDLYSMSSSDDNISGSYDFDDTDSGNASDQDVDTNASIGIDTAKDVQFQDTASDLNSTLNANRSDDVTGASIRVGEGVFEECEFDWSESALGHLPYQ